MWWPCLLTDRDEMSNLHRGHCARFNALVKDVFPGIEFKDIEFDKLAEAIRTVCKEKNLKINEIQVCLDQCK
jgi:dynein heavy chain 2